MPRRKRPRITTFEVGAWIGQAIIGGVVVLGLLAGVSILFGVVWFIAQ